MKQIKTVISYTGNGFDKAVNYYLRKGFVLVKRELRTAYTTVNENNNPVLFLYAELERDKICKA